MTQMPPAPGAAHLHPSHSETVISRLRHILLRDRLRETRPARARIELAPRIEQRGPAANAPIHPVRMQIPVLARVRQFRIAPTRHHVLIHRERRLPLRIRLSHRRNFRDPGQPSRPIELRNPHLRRERPRVIVRPAQPLTQPPPGRPAQRQPEENPPLDSPPYSSFACPNAIT